nr:unnamed protein product [Digitaria exilis]
MSPSVTSVPFRNSVPSLPSVPNRDSSSTCELAGASPCTARPRRRPWTKDSAVGHWSKGARGFEACTHHSLRSPAMEKSGGVDDGGNDCGGSDDDSHSDGVDNNDGGGGKRDARITFCVYLLKYIARTINKDLTTYSCYVKNGKPNKCKPSLTASLSCKSLFVSGGWGEIRGGLPVASSWPIHGLRRGRAVQGLAPASLHVDEGFRRGDRKESRLGTEGSDGTESRKATEVTQGGQFPVRKFLKKKKPFGDSAAAAASKEEIEAAKEQRAVERMSLRSLVISTRDPPRAGADPTAGTISPLLLLSFFPVAHLLSSPRAAQQRQPSTPGPTCRRLSPPPLPLAPWAHMSAAPPTSSRGQAELLPGFAPPRRHAALGLLASLVRTPRGSPPPLYKCNPPFRKPARTNPSRRQVRAAAVTLSLLHRRIAANVESSSVGESRGTRRAQNPSSSPSPPHARPRRRHQAAAGRREPSPPREARFRPPKSNPSPLSLGLIAASFVPPARSVFRRPIEIQRPDLKTRFNPSRFTVNPRRQHPAVAMAFLQKSPCIVDEPFEFADEPVPEEQEQQQFTEEGKYNTDNPCYLYTI